MKAPKNKAALKLILSSSKQAKEETRTPVTRCPAPPALTETENISQESSSREDKQCRPKSNKPKAPTELVTIHLDPNIVGDISPVSSTMECESQIKTPALKHGRNVSLDSSKSAVSQQIAQECLLGLENFSDALEIIAETFKNQLNSSRENLERLRNHVGKG
jgi:hypothetical protein